MPPPCHNNLKSGFTLLEAMIALTILGIVLMAFTGAILISQKLATENLMRTSAYLAAQSYLDQIRSMPSMVLNQSIDSPTKYALPTQRVSMEAEKSPSGQDPLYLNKINDKTILIDAETKQGGKTYTRTLDISITPKIKDLSPTLNAYEIQLDFSYKARHTRTTSHQNGNVRFLKIKPLQ